MKFKRVLPNGHTTSPQCEMPVIEASIAFEWVNHDPTGGSSWILRSLNSMLYNWQIGRRKLSLPTVPVSMVIHLSGNDHDGNTMVLMIRAQLDPLAHASMSENTMHTIFEDLVHMMCENLGSTSGTIRCGSTITRLDFTQI
jgi:hypothetical protein